MKGTLGEKLIFAGMNLHFKEYGSGPPFLILHGFMGSLDNWHTLATQFGSGHHVFTLDLRNHGKSPHTESHTLDLMVTDLKNFIEQKQLGLVSLLGHSMGGKVVMQFALNYPELVDHLVVVDIAPRLYPPGHDDVFKAIFAVDLKRIQNRKEAEAMMEPFIQDAGTRLFLLKNLERREDGGFQWKMNLNTLHKDYHEIIKNIDSETPFLGKTLVIKGGRSRYITEKDETDFARLFPEYRLISIPGAGHWVHAEKPAELLEAVNGFLEL